MKLALPNFSQKEITRKTADIYSEFLSKSLAGRDGNFTIIRDSDLRKLFELYDRDFFGGYFTANYKDRLTFAFSNKMTKAGGKLQYSKTKNRYKIVLSVFLLYRSFNGDEREIKVNGIVCQDRLEAAMRIMEHEIVHLLEYVIYGNSSCSKPRFRSISGKLFNHTEVTHQLVTQREIAHSSFDLHIGDKVTFEFEGKILEGMIYRINKRATVMVKNKKGQYSDTKGNRYEKYYIPLKMLRKDGMI